MQRSVRGPIGVGLAAPAVLTGIVAVVFMFGTDATGTSRLGVTTNGSQKR